MCIIILFIYTNSKINALFLFYIHVFLFHTFYFRFYVLTFHLTITGQHDLWYCLVYHLAFYRSIWSEVLYKFYITQPPDNTLNDICLYPLWYSLHLVYLSHLRFSSSEMSIMGFGICRCLSLHISNFVVKESRKGCWLQFISVIKEITFIMDLMVYYI